MITRKLECLHLSPVRYSGNLSGWSTGSMVTSKAYFRIFRVRSWKLQWHSIRKGLPMDRCVGFTGYKMIRICQPEDQPLYSSQYTQGKKKFIFSSFTPWALLNNLFLHYMGLLKVFILISLLTLEWVGEYFGGIALDRWEVLLHIKW